MTFLIPVNLLVADAKDVTYSFARAVLNVPWESSRFLGLSHPKITNAYPIIMGLLPSSPGRIKFVVSVRETGSDRRHYKGPNHHVGARREEGNNDQHVDLSDTATPGCSIDRGSTQIHGSGTGDQSFGIKSIDTTQVVSHADAIHHGFGSSGVCDFWIEFDEMCPTSSVRDLPETVINDASRTTLKWGDRRSYPLPANLTGYKVSYDSFDGQHLEYSAPSATADLYVKILRENDSLVFEAANPASLRSPY